MHEKISGKGRASVTQNNQRQHHRQSGLWVHCKEACALKNWCFWTVVLETTLESPLDCKEIKTVNPKGNQPWIFIGRTDAEAEALILFPPDSLEKTLTLGKIEGRRRRGRQRMKWLDGITDSMNMSVSKPMEIVKARGAWKAAVQWVAKSLTGHSI